MPTNAQPINEKAGNAARERIVEEIADEVARRLTGPGSVSYSDGCGNLDALCRPRFFAGQVLTDDDLNRLDVYIRQKNRLHNRYLHGWGVVCGLKVNCSPCRGFVTISPGYALSPCGDDILVDHNVSLDICEMLKDCRVKLRPPCDPTRPGDGGNDNPNNDKTPEIEEWDLMIRYAERSMRGVTPLRNPSGKSCACGGKCGCGGNCGSRPCCGQYPAGTSGRTVAQNYAAAYTPTAHNAAKGGKAGGAYGAQARCEPTIICEGYQFELCRPDTRPKPKDPITATFTEEMKSLINVLKSIGQANNGGDVYEAALDARQTLLDKYDCADDWLIHRLRSYSPLLPPSPNMTEADLNAYKGSVSLPLYRLGLLLLLRQVCFAILPTCPAPTCDDRLGLARLTVYTDREGQRRIVAICNYAPRRFVMTFPNLSHWLSWTKIFDVIRAAILGVCCPPLPFWRRGGLFNARMMAMTRETGGAAPAGDALTRPMSANEGGAAGGGDNSGGDNEEPLRPWSLAGVRRVLPDLPLAARLFRSARSRSRRGAEPLTVVELFGDAATRKRAGVTPEEQANPEETVAIGQILLPALRDLSAATGAGEMAEESRTPENPTFKARRETASNLSEVPDGDVSLRDEVNSLRDQLAAQSELIEELRRKVG